MPGSVHFRTGNIEPAALRFVDVKAAAPRARGRRRRRALTSAKAGRNPQLPVRCSTTSLCARVPLDAISVRLRDVQQGSRVLGSDQ